MTFYIIQALYLRMISTASPSLDVVPQVHLWEEVPTTLFAYLGDAFWCWTWHLGNSHPSPSLGIHLLAQILLEGQQVICCLAVQY